MKIGDWELVPLTSHAEIIGIELAKAEVALNQGLIYRQDRPLDFNQKFEAEVVVSEKVDTPVRYVKKGKKSIRV